MKEISRRDARRTAAGLFLLALALRLLFWQATADAPWPHSAAYKGDAPLWLDYATALEQGTPFELGLPLRPPGAAWLVAALWGGRVSGLWLPQLAWCLMGAAVAPLVWGAARRSFGRRPALLAGLACAASSGLMVLSTSLNNETPYLLLVAALLWLWEPLWRRPRVPVVAAAAALHALACLVRVEHALFFALTAVALGWLWARPEGAAPAWRRSLGRLALTAAIFALMLLPWHLHAWRAIERFNREPLAMEPAAEAAVAEVERVLAVGGVTWHPEAVGERERLPGCCRRTAGVFVAATVAVRGGREVRAEDFQVLEEAFGARPGPLPEHPFVAFYGPLNFFLSNNPQADGGFGRAPLERPPPLAGGIGRYPGILVQGLPPPQLTFTYPPHLEIARHGYRLGWRWMRTHPGDFLRLAGEKLRLFWQGTAMGFGGFNLPLGLSGLRRPVDLAVPQGTAAALWRLLLLALALAGVWAARRRRWEIFPWLAFLGSKVVVTVAFFGYARQGATVVPVVALLAALAVEGVLARRGGGGEELSPRAWKRWQVGVAAAALLLLAAEGARWAAGPELLLDGRPVGAADPFPLDEYDPRRLEVRW